MPSEIHPMVQALIDMAWELCNPEDLAVQRRAAEVSAKMLPDGYVAVPRSVLELTEKIIRPLTVQANPGRILLAESNARFAQEQILAALTKATES